MYIGDITSSVKQNLNVHVYKQARMTSSAALYRNHFLICIYGTIEMSVSYERDKCTAKYFIEVNSLFYMISHILEGTL